MAVAAVLLFAGCGGTADGSSHAKSTHPKTSVETKVYLDALGLALDDLQPASDQYLSADNDCLKIGQAGDSRGLRLCLHAADRPWLRALAVVDRSFDTLKKRAPRGWCQAPLRAVLNRYGSVETDVGDASVFGLLAVDPNRLTQYLNKIDNAFLRLNASFAHAQDQCGG